MSGVKILNNMMKPALLSRLVIGKRAFAVTAFNSKKAQALTKVPFDDGMFFSLASNLMRNLEREFDMVSRRPDDSRRRLDETRRIQDAVVTCPIHGQHISPAFMDKAKSGANYMLVDNKDGVISRKFQLSFDLSDFDPEEVKIKTCGNTINISAKKEKQVTLK